MKAFIYVRTSTKRQQTSLKNQIEQCSHYCKSAGLVIQDTYIDEGKSGRLPIDKRGELRRLLKDIRSQNILLCTYPDRLARGLKIMEEIECIIKRKGAKIFFLCYLNNDFIKAENQLKNNILGAIAEYSAINDNGLFFN